MSVRITLTDAEIRHLLAAIHGAIDEAEDDEETCATLARVEQKIRRARRS